jgi:hypothetical protein
MVMYTMYIPCRCNNYLQGHIGMNNYWQSTACTIVAVASYLVRINWKHVTLHIKWHCKGGEIYWWWNARFQSSQCWRVRIERSCRTGVNDLYKNWTAFWRRFHSELDFVPCKENEPIVHRYYKRVSLFCLHRPLSRLSWLRHWRFWPSNVFEHRACAWPVVWIRINGVYTNNIYK